MRSWFQMKKAENPKFAKFKTVKQQIHSKIFIFSKNIPKYVPSFVMHLPPKGRIRDQKSVNSHKVEKQPFLVDFKPSKTQYWTILEILAV